MAPWYSQFCVGWWLLYAVVDGSNGVDGGPLWREGGNISPQQTSPWLSDLHFTFTRRRIFLLILYTHREIKNSFDQYIKSIVSGIYL